LANALQQNRTLTTLNLDGNRIGVKGERAIVAGIRQNGMITSIDFYNCYPFERYLERNKNAHEKARKAAIALLTGYNKLSNLKSHERQTTDYLLNWFLTQRNPQDGYLKIDQLGSKYLITRLAMELWSSRANPKWWTDEERREAGLESEVSKRLKSCIQCQLVEARFYEKGASDRLFCGSYCQWLEHTKLPDLRGKSPEFIEQWVLKNQNQLSWNGGCYSRVAQGD
jgi:hypothetical protein